MLYNKMALLQSLQQIIKKKVFNEYKESSASLNVRLDAGSAESS